MAVTVTLTKLDERWFPFSCCGVEYNNPKKLMDHVLDVHESCAS